MVGHARRSWSLAVITCQDLTCILHTSMRLAYETCWGIIIGILTTTYVVPPLSCNVIVRQNMAIGWIPRMHGQCLSGKSLQQQGGYIAIQISSQTTKKEVSKNSPLRTIILRKLLSFCDTITLAPIQLQVLRNSRNWYNHKTFPIITASIHRLRFTVHRKLFAVKPSLQPLNESTQKSISFRYKI